MAAHLIVEEAHPHTSLGPLDEMVLDLAPDLVVVHDEELEEDVLLGLIDEVEDVAKCGVAVDQQLHRVALEVGNPGQQLGGPAGGAHLLGRRPELVGRSLGLVADAGDLLQPASAGAGVSLKTAAPEHPVCRHRDIRKGVERHRPGNGALLGSSAHDGVDGGDGPQHVKQDHSGRNHPSSPLPLRAISILLRRRDLAVGLAIWLTWLVFLRSFLCQRPHRRSAGDHHQADEEELDAEQDANGPRAGEGKLPPDHDAEQD